MSPGLENAKCRVLVAGALARWASRCALFTIGSRARGSVGPRPLALSKSPLFSATLFLNSSLKNVIKPAGRNIGAAAPRCCAGALLPSARATLGGEASPSLHPLVVIQHILPLTHAFTPRDTPPKPCTRTRPRCGCNSNLGTCFPHKVDEPFTRRSWEPRQPARGLPPWAPPQRAWGPPPPTSRGSAPC